MEKVDVILTTWARYSSRVKYLKDTLQSLKDNLIATGCELVFTVGAEGREAPYQNQVKQVCTEYNANLVINDDLPNLGRNLNNLHQNTQNPWVLYIQDDFQLDLPLDIGPDVQIMKKNSSIDMVRYTWRKIEPHEYKTSTYDPSLLLLNPSSRHLYSDNPHLRRRDWLERTGPYSTLDNSACENQMNDTARKRKMHVLLKDKQPFRHSGLETVMWEKWAKHPRGWAASLFVTPEMAARYKRSWRISWEVHDFLIEHLRTNLPRSILETGPGMSSILFYQYAQKVPEVDYFVLNHPSPYHEPFIDHMKELGFDTSNVFLCPLQNEFYQLNQVTIPKNQVFDLIILDGPPGTNGRTSPQAMEFLKTHTGPRTTILVDDTHRSERKIVDCVKSWFPPDHFNQITIQDSNFERNSTVLVPNKSKVKTAKVIVESPAKDNQKKTVIKRSLERLLKASNLCRPSYKPTDIPPDAVQQERLNRMYDQLEKRGLVSGPRIRALDIGPGHPYFLVLMRELGHIADGIESPEVAVYKAVLHHIGIPVHFFHITPNNLLPPLEGQYDLINATGIQFDVYKGGSRWEGSLWVEVIKTWLEILKPGGKIFAARNWEFVDEDPNKPIVRHYQDPTFLNFLSRDTRIESWSIDAEILTLTKKLRVKK